MEQNLVDFDWDNNEEFFGVEIDTPTPAPKPKEKEEEEDTPPTPPEEVEEDTPEEVSFFDEEDNEEEEEDTPKPKDKQPNDFWGDVYKDFKENGFLENVDIEEGEELSAERLLELQEDNYEKEVVKRLQAWTKEELDEDAQAFIKFKLNGGSTQEFFSTYSKASSIPSGDLKDETYQDAVIRYQLKSEGWDAEEIEDRLDYLTNSGKKEAIAKRYDKKVKESYKAQEQILQQEQEARIAQAEEQDRLFKANIKSTLDETEEVNGFKITDKDKTELYNFLTKKNYKVSDSKSVTGFQKKLGEIFQDSQKMLLLAKLVSSDFDMSGFEKKVITKKTKQIKSNLEQRQNLRPTKTGSSSGSSLADLFN